jgi:hypothetical protein
MNDKCIWGFSAGLLVAVVGVAGCGRSQSEISDSAEVKLNGKTMRVSGPYTHENLSVFLIHSPRQDRRDFLTLHEGLKKGQVKITEKEQEQVEELTMENQSDRPLYLQEGERLQGGKQDRTIIASLVISPKSGKVTVPTACIEQSRWEEGAEGKKFRFTVSAALAPKGVRGAGKVENSQQMVWNCVVAQKVTAHASFKTPNTNTSANEMLDAPQARKISDRFTEALKGAFDGHRDAVGVAIVINNQVEEINIYPSNRLLAKLYPRLIGAYALQATMLKDQAEEAECPSPAAIAKFLTDEQGKEMEEKKIARHNKVQIRELEDEKFICTTHYKGKLVHWQMMKKNGSQRGDGDEDKKKADKRTKTLGSEW